MNIAEMHVWFRQYAQQMGMQNVRAILPEQIDLLINTSITDILNQLIQTNIGLTNDRIITDNSKLGQINAFRTLYNVTLIDLAPKPPTTTETRTFEFSASDRNNGRMTTSFSKVSPTSFIPDYLFLVDFSINYKQVIGNAGYTGISTKNNMYSIELVKNGVWDSSKYIATDILDGEIVTLTVRDVASDIENTTDISLKFIHDSDNPGLFKCITSPYTNKYLGIALSSYGEIIEDCYCLCDSAFSTIGVSTPPTNPVQVTNDVPSYKQPIFLQDGIETNYFPVRLIDDAYLADTLNDFVLRNRLRSPIIVTYNNGVFDLYIDKFHSYIVNGIPRYILDNNLIPYKLRMSYIAKPAIVKYATDVGGVDVDCNLPESMHIDILKHAVDLYNISVNGNLYAAQQQQQNQNREMSRNQARPDNEGYKS